MEASSEGETGRVGRDTVIGIEVVDVELTCEKDEGEWIRLMLELLLLLQKAHSFKNLGQADVSWCPSGNAYIVLFV